MLLHPIGLTRTFWADVVDELEQDFLTIAVDLPGHGESDVAGGDYSINTIAADCAELIATLAGQACVVGCSMGASVAQIMAADHSETVTALVLANTSGPRGAGRTDTLEARARHALNGLPSIAEETVSRWFSAGFKAANPDKIDWITTMLASGDPYVHWRAWLALAGRPDDHYDRICVPTLAIAGSEDPGASPAAVQRLAAAIKGAQYHEITGAGHLVPVEQPDVFAAVVKRFVEANESG